MTLSKPVWKQDLDLLAYDLFTSISQQLFCLLINQNNFALCTDDDDPIGSRLQKPAKLGLRGLSGGTGNLLVMQFSMSSVETGFARVNAAFLRVGFFPADYDNLLISASSYPCGRVYSPNELVRSALELPFDPGKR